MFDIKELTTAEVSVFSGKAALKAMQNEHTFLLDLLVRESIQNSSDAALDGQVFKVFYNIGKFQNYKLAPYFDKISKKLEDRYDRQTCNYLEIRDSNTCGLDGETLKSKCKNSTKSNYLRLIFDMGNGQDQEKAGGNWGYGKTVYYRLGNGIVIYYSRTINEEENYESRLILTLIEDEKSKDALLKNEDDNSAGRAWWGKLKDNDICPITDEYTVKEFLDIFGIVPFKDNETGTSIIIPYIDERSLMEEAKSGFKVGDEEDDGKSIRRCTFLDSISSYLKYAIQKWYAPIINNFKLINYGRKFLNAHVDGVPVRRDEIYPIFKLVQELYLTAYAKLNDVAYHSEYPIICEETNGSYRNSKRNYKFGYVAFLKTKLTDFQKEELLLPPNVYMNVADKDYNRIVSLYTRDLGMILNYDEHWVSNIDVAPDEILVTMFVPDTNIEIDDYGVGIIELGEYLRQREEADHMKWDDDPANMKFKCVAKIKSSVDKSVRQHFNPQQPEESVESNESAFAKFLGAKLFPKIKNKSSSGGGSGSGEGIVRKEKLFNFTTKRPVITPKGRIKVDFELEIKGKTTLVIKTKVTSAGAIDADMWGKKIGTTYPIKISNAEFKQKENDTEIRAEESNGELIICGEKNKVSGSFEIEALDKKLAFTIDCEEMKGKR